MNNIDKSEEVKIGGPKKSKWITYVEKIGEGVGSKWGMFVYRAFAFFEATVIPFPADIILAVAVYTRTQELWKFVRITVLWSVAGGVAGYFIGSTFFDFVITFFPDINEFTEKVFSELSGNYFEIIYISFVFAFSPLFPYKLFVFSSGALGLGVIPFLIGSIVGRGLRYSIVAILVKYFGKDAYKLGWKKNLLILLLLLVLSLYFLL